MAHVDKNFIAEQNKKHESALNYDFDALGNQLQRRGIDIEHITKRAETFQVAVPSWGTGTGGTRFARFPGIAEPRNISEKLED